MKKNKNKLLALAVWSLAGSAACGPTPSAEDVLVCGGGTVLENGECVRATEPADCGEGTVLDEDENVCVPAVECGPGTTFNPTTASCDPDTECGGDTVFDSATGLCMPTTVCGDDTIFNPATSTCDATVLCGPNTELQDGACVAEDRCGSGTTFNPLEGICEPDTICGPGLIEYDGACSTPNAALAAEADVVEAEPNDPLLGGAAETLSLPDLGERVVFSGTIARPADLDNDGDADQDVDVWSFEGEAAQVLSIAIRENGAPQPAFTLSGPGGYERSSAVGAPFEANRVVVLPRDGTYTLRVTTSSARFAPEGPDGDDDYGYVGVIEALEWPGEVPVVPAAAPEVETVEGTVLDTMGNFYAVSASQAANVVVRFTSEGLSAWPVLLAFDANRNFIGELRPDKVQNAPAGTMCDASQEVIDCIGSAACVGASGPGLAAFGTCAPASPVPGFVPAFSATRGVTSPTDDGIIVVVDWVGSVGFDSPFALGFTAEQDSVFLDATAGDLFEAPDQTAVAGGLAGFGFDLPADQLATIRFDQIRTDTTQPAFISAFGPGDLIEAGISLSDGAFRFHTGDGGLFSFTYINEGDADIGVSAAIQLSPTPRITFDGTPLRSVVEGERLDVGQRFADKHAFIVQSELEAAALVKLDAPSLSRLDSRIQSYRLAPSGAVTEMREADGQNQPALGALVGPDSPVLFVVDPRFSNTKQVAAIDDYRIDLEVNAFHPIENASTDNAEAAANIQSMVAGEIYAGSLEAGEIAYYEVALPAPLESGQVVEVIADNDGAGTQPLALELFDSLGSDTALLSSSSPTAPTVLYTVDQGTGPFVVRLSAPASYGLQTIVRARVRDAVVIEEPSDAASPMVLEGASLPTELVGFTSPNDKDAVVITLASPLAEREGILLHAVSVSDRDDVRVEIQEGDGTPIEFVQGMRVSTLVRPADGTSLRLLVSGNPATKAHAYQVRLSRVDNVEDNPWQGDVVEDLGVVGAVPLVRLAASGRNETDLFTFDADGPLSSGEALVVRWENQTSANPIKVIVADVADAPVAYGDYVRGALAVPGSATGPFTVSFVNDASVFGGDRVPEVYSFEIERISAQPETEPNDTTAAATPLALPATVVGQSRGEGAAGGLDSDVYAITLSDDLAPGEELHVQVSTLLLKAASVALLDENGAVLGLERHFDIDTRFPLPVGAAGTTYFVVIEHDESAAGSMGFYEAVLEIAASGN